jgi:hypothetical protein
LNLASVAAYSAGVIDYKKIWIKANFLQLSNHRLKKYW